MFNERNDSICYTTATYEVHTLKNKKKESHFPGCRFVIIEIRAFDKARDENAITSLIT